MSYLFRCLLGLAGLLLIAGLVRAQGPVGYGDWQLHLPTNHPLRLADAGDRLYVATENAFYFLDKKQNTTQVLSRRDGLNDVKVVALAYDSVSKQTVVVYANTNIDVLRPNGSVRNLSDVLRKSIQGKKEAYRVSISGTKAYISTSFGIVVLDLTKLEISDTYSNIGVGGTVAAVYDVTITGTTIVAATSGGLLRASLTNNLLDYRNWILDQQPLPTGPATPNAYRVLATFAGQIYAGVDNPGLNLYKFVPASAGTLNRWQLVPNTYTVQFRTLRANVTGLYITDDTYGVRRLDRNGVVTTVVPPRPGTFTTDAVRSRDGSHYVANYEVGLQWVRPSQPTEVFEANGPESSNSFGLLADARSNKVNVFTGGYSERYLPFGRLAGFYEYADGQWTNVTSLKLPVAAFPNPINVSRGTRTPDGTLYIANFGGGLLEWKGPGAFRRFTSTAASAPSSPILPYAVVGNDRVSDVTSDAGGNVYVVNPHGVPNTSGLYVFTPSANTWRTIPWVPNFENLDRITLDDQGLVWATVARKPNNPSISGQTEGGLFVIDPNAATTQRPRFFSTSAGLPDNQLYEVVKDRRGYIWAATIKGVAVFNDPSGPFGADAKFTLPYVRRGEGKDFPVLFTEAVRTLAVDGGDRKWFGTDHGLWLFSPDADEALMHFTKENSPLPSNRIVDVKVNDKTGEVWVATDAGVVAYRGSATITEGDPKCTAVFPNPVRPDFAGTVGITGLANNGLVKITDVAGHLVYATKANGGAVTWNLTNPDGQRVRSGVYLVLSSDADGKNGCISKIAVLSK